MPKKGFTLIELLVVIAIIAILTMIVISFDFNKKTDTEKQDRFTQKIASMIRSTYVDTLSGRGIKSGANIINPTNTRILISTGSVGVYYYSGNTIIGTGEVMNRSFFGDAGYGIENIYLKDKTGWEVTPANDSPVEIVFSTSDISFSGSIGNSGAIIGMDIGYKWAKNILEFDRRFGKVCSTKGCLENIDGRWMCTSYNPSSWCMHWVTTGVADGAGFWCPSGGYTITETSSPLTSFQCIKNVGMAPSGFPPLPPSPIFVSQSGSCDNTRQFSCSPGRAVETFAGTCGTKSTWHCDGLNGGAKTAVKCEIANPACLPSCKALRDSGYASDGVYTIDPDGAGPNAPVSVYCDMTTDGGGWTLIMSSASWGTCPGFGIRGDCGSASNSSLPYSIAIDKLGASDEVLTYRTQPGSRKPNGYIAKQRFSHALWGDKLVLVNDKIQFLSTDSCTNRVMGTELPQLWHIGVTTLVDKFIDDNGPYVGWGYRWWDWWFGTCMFSGTDPATYHCGAGIFPDGFTSASYGRWLNNACFVYNMGGPGGTYQTGNAVLMPEGSQAAVFIREGVTSLPVPLKSCLAIKEASPGSADGIYTIKPDGASPMNVYCDMTTDGGGWTVIASDGTGTYTQNLSIAGAVPTPTEPGMIPYFINGKLRDFSSEMRIVSTANSNSNVTYLTKQGWLGDARLRDSEYGYMYSSDKGFDGGALGAHKCNFSTIILTGCTYPTTWPANGSLIGAVAGNSQPWYGAGPYSWRFDGNGKRFRLGWTVPDGSFSFPPVYNYYADPSYLKSYLMIRDKIIPVMYASCSAIKDGEINPPDGIYSIDTDLDGPELPFEVYCDMTTDGGGWTRVYDLDIPTNSDWNSYGDIPYATSLSGKIMPFTQVAYRMQLDTNYVFASMTDFSSWDITKLGVPVDWQYQKNITGLNIVSNQVASASGSAGKMEFWHNCYSRPWGNDNLFDYFDTINSASPHCYGSMQVSNGTGTVFAFNKWSDAGVNDVGIGTNPGVHPDWTFTYNAGSYTTKKMAVYIRDKVIPPVSYASCSAIKKAVPASLDGNYTVDPDGTGGMAPFEVYCDMTTDGGGWTVFQRRKDGGTDFYRDWAQYQWGFGDIGGEHWLGNDRIAAMTKQSKTLRIDMANTVGAKYYAQYGRFKIGDSSTKYKLNVANYTGNAGDSLSWHNNFIFSTFDQDNDIIPSNCAVTFHGAWWYSSCHSSNLNGLWLNGQHNSSYANGVDWVTFPGLTDGATNGYYYSLPFTEMKFRDKLNFSSCKEIKDANPASLDGTYTIDPDGDTGSAPFSAYCDMTTDGGGWTLTAWNKGTSSMVPANFFVSAQNKSNAANKSMTNTAASINPEAFSRAVNTTSAMLKSSAYNSTPIIENNFGTWDYNNTKCTGSLVHSSRTAWCPGQNANDDYTSADGFNIAVWGGIGIVPGWLNMWQELCYSGKWWCDFEFYLREGDPATNYVSCSAIKNANPFSTDGTYSIDPDGAGGNDPFPVYCDMTTDGGGWTVFQRRKDGSTDFYRDWAQYQGGFGDIKGEHWLGNDRLAAMTKGAKTLRIDMANTVGAKYYAKYNTFQIGDGSTKYRLNVSGYSGTAGDALSYQNGHPFTTKDQDNDNHPSANCATLFQGAWWYNYCHNSNLNGLWLNGKHTSYADGVDWMWFPGLTDGAPDGHHYSLPFTEMKFRDKPNFSSCKEIKDANPASVNGTYTIDPDGDGGNAPFSAYCDMTTDGGGWTLTAWNKGASSMVPTNFFVSEQNKSNAANKSMANTAASINPETFSRAVSTTSDMLKSSAYNSTPIIENNFGTWDYNNTKCTGSLLHTSRTAWCSQIANDQYNWPDSFNIAMGNNGIVPTWLSTGNELCYSGKGWCDFEFYLREGSATNYVSCNAIKAAFPDSTDGNYSIDPDGAGGNAPFSVYCDMTTDGGGWTRVYDMDLPAVTGWASFANIPYATSLSGKVMPFTQVAYRMQLDSNYVFASMNDFSSGDIKKLGVPVEWQYQKNVSGLNIVSNVIPNATNSAGIMEFWHNCYAPAGGNSSLYDYLDQYTVGSPHCYGSMQISNGTDTVFAFNRWSATANYDLGLGNQPTANPDWTYAQNSNTFTTKRLSVFIRDKVLPLPLASCKAIKTAIPTSPDGMYTIDPDGAGGNAAFPAYCDMTTDGGGWTLAVRIKANGTNEHGLASAIGTLYNPTQSTLAKLSDSAINQIKNEWIFRFTCRDKTGYYKLTDWIWDSRHETSYGSNKLFWSSTYGWSYIETGHSAWSSYGLSNYMYSWGINPFGWHQNYFPTGYPAEWAPNFWCYETTGLWWWDGVVWVK